MPEPSTSPSPPHKATLRVTTLLRPHWKAMTLALLAVLGDTLADLLQPWPLKIVVDNVVRNPPKKLPGWIGDMVTGLFAGDRYGTVNCAVGAVAGIAIGGA